MTRARGKRGGKKQRGNFSKILHYLNKDWPKTTKSHIDWNTKEDSILRKNKTYLPALAPGYGRNIAARE